MEALAFLAGMSVDGYRQIGLGFAVGGFLVAGGAYRIARRAGQRDAADMMARDKRPPVLLLRSFADDGLRLFAHRSSRQTTLEPLHFRRRERFEELLAWTLQTYGPVVAIAEPGRHGRPIGAPRERIDDPDWLSIVEDGLRVSAHVVVVVGRTAGLASEIAVIRETGLLDRTLFVLPPVAATEVADRWNGIASTLGVEATLSAKDEGAVLFRLIGDEVFLYQGESRRPHLRDGHRLGSRLRRLGIPSRP